MNDGLRYECLGVEEELSRMEVRDEELAELVGLPNVREGSDIRREIMGGQFKGKIRNTLGSSN